MKLQEVLVLIVLEILSTRVSGQMDIDEIDENYVESTVEMETVQTTTVVIEIVTDIPEEDVEAALNLDAGEYTTQVFGYQNFAFNRVRKYEECMQQYFKCLLDLAVPSPICAVNDPFEIRDGYITYQTYCELYLDNCRRHRHFWRILDYGQCYHASRLHATLVETKRRFSVERPWKYIFHVLGAKDQRSKFITKFEENFIP